MEPSNKAYAYAAKDKSAESGGLRWVRQFSSLGALIVFKSCLQAVTKA
jgi:hypothetical protein